MKIISIEKLRITIVLTITLLLVACSSGGGDNSNAGNNAPIANAGTDWNTLVNSMATLDSSRSSDPDGDSFTYSWSLSVPAGSSAVLSDSTAASPSFTADVIGTYTASLVVNDGMTDSNPDSVTIKVGPFNFADYQPADSLTNCSSTMQWTIGPDVGQQYSIAIGGNETVNYTSGALEGTTITNWLDESGASILGFNDGVSFKVLKATASGGDSVLVSTDCSLSAHPDEWSFGEITDGMIKDQTGTYYTINASNLSDCNLADPQQILIKIQNVTVQGTLYQNAVVWYWLDSNFTYPAAGLDFSGKETEFGLTLPTSVETGGVSPTAIDIYAFGTGTLASGDVAAETGLMPYLSERISTTCP